jgi:signal transduction histidine kinase/CheY-like chemotaxis protein
MNPNDLFFNSLKEDDRPHLRPGLKLLIVDDEPQVHRMTEVVLKQLRFEGRPLQFLNAYSSKEGQDMMSEHRDVAVILLDVVMETEHAGLELVRWIRQQCHNTLVRIILRTGQPGQAPERYVIENYDINDYREKTELTSQKLSSVVYTALRSYHDLVTIAAAQKTLQSFFSFTRYLKTPEGASSEPHFMGVYRHLSLNVFAALESMFLQQTPSEKDDPFFTLPFTIIHDGSQRETLLPASPTQRARVRASVPFEDLHPPFKNLSRHSDSYLFSHLSIHDDFAITLGFLVEREPTASQWKLWQLIEPGLHGIFSTAFWMGQAQKDQKAARTASQFMESLLDGISSLIFVCRECGEIVALNRSAEDCFSEAKGQSLFALLPALQDYRHLFTYTLESLEHQSVFRVALHIPDIAYADLFFHPLPEEQPPCVIVRMEDRTPAVSTELQLIQAQKMEAIGTLTGGLTHDLNNLFCALGNSLALIKSKSASLDSNLQEQWRLSEMTLTRGTELLQHFLQFSKPNPNQFHFVDLLSLLEMTQRLCQNTLPKQLTISFSLPQGSFFCFGDQSLLLQVLLNLCINASQAIEARQHQKPRTKEGHLQVVLHPKPILRELPQGRKNACWHMEIKDNGIGIAENIRSRIFDPFFTTKGNEGGTGLGLSMVATILKNHSGAIHFDSPPEGGCTFHVFLPAAKAPQHREKTAVEDPLPVVQPTGPILIIDDEFSIRETTAELLKTQNFQVVTASHGEEGLTQARDLVAIPQAVFLDIAMPGLSCKDTMTGLKALFPTVPIILISGLQEGPTIGELMAQPGVKFLPKPFTLKDLLQSISHS